MFKAQTYEQQSRWEDEVYLPALHRAYDAHYMLHLPASFDHAYANSKAHHIEERLVATTSYEGQRSVGYHLQPEGLDAVWSDILHTVSSTPGLADFREPQLFISAKETKLRFKTNSSRPSLLHAMRHFQSYIEEAVDFPYIDLDRFYVDIGK